MNVLRSLQSHSAVFSARRNVLQRATKYVINRNIRGVDRLIKGGGTTVLSMSGSSQHSVIFYLVLRLLCVLAQRFCVLYNRSDGGGGGGGVEEVNKSIFNRSSCMVSSIENTIW